MPIIFKSYIQQEWCKENIQDLNLDQATDYLDWGFGSFTQSLQTNPCTAPSNMSQVPSSKSVATHLPNSVDTITI